MSRARFETHLYGVTIPDPDEVVRHHGPGDEADPRDTAALARAMAKDASQDLASALDPLAPEVADLVACAPSWLHAERAALAEFLRAGPPLEEGLRRVRSALADAYDLPLQELECPQLRSVMTAALRVPGATPERLAQLMVGRAEDGPRELESARNPIAVLVWAGGRHALPVLAAEARTRERSDSRPPAERAGEVTAQRRLRLVDSALARQREARLAALEAATEGPVVDLLGPAPHYPAGLRPWRRAAAALLDYRDTAALPEASSPGEDPWIKALGSRPTDPVLAAHHDQVETIVARCCAEVLLAEICRHRPPLPLRPALAVATLAERPLFELDASLAVARQAVNDPAVTIAAHDELASLEQAVTAREAQLRTHVLSHPPEWVRADVVARTTRKADGIAPDPARLASVYGDAAIQAERSGDPNAAASLLPEMLDRQLQGGPADGLAAELETLLGLAGVDNRGIGLGL